MKMEFGESERSWNELIGNADTVRFTKKQKNGLARTRDACGWRENG